MHDTAELRAQLIAIDDAIERTERVGIADTKASKGLASLIAERTQLRSVLDERELADFMGRLRSNDPDAVKVRDWLRRRTAGWAEDTGRGGDDVDAFLVSLELFVRSLHSVTEWDAVPVKERRRRAKRIANTARSLAELLDRSPGPDWPDAFALFDPAPAGSLLADLAPSEAADILSKEFEPPKVLSLIRRNQPEQTVAGILRNLARDAEKRASRAGTKEARPRTGEVDARAFAKAVAEYLHFTLGLTRAPCEAIARIVMLRFPGIEPIPTAALVRKWIS